MRVEWIAGALLVVSAGCYSSSESIRIPTEPGRENLAFVSEDVSANVTWTADMTWVLTQTVFVTDGVLTIEPGTTVVGMDGAALIVGSEARLEASGTRDEPIVFTSFRAPGERRRGDWGGLVLLGDAVINEGWGYPRRRTVEGVDPRDERAEYGGEDDASDCGTLRYVRIEFAGDEFALADELNGLTLAGCGSATEVEYVQVHMAEDDGVEVFGGSVDLKHLVISRSSDDSLDWDQGWRGRAQHVVIYQDPELGESGIEANSCEGDEPRSEPLVYNVTMVGSGNAKGIKIREGSWGIMRNFLVTRFGREALDVVGEDTAEGANTGGLTIENSLFFRIGEDGSSFFPDEPGAEDDDGRFDEVGHFMAPERGNLFGLDPQLGDLNLRSAPDLVPVVGSPVTGAGAAPPDDGFFDPVDYVGAFAPGGVDWSSRWTSFAPD